MARIKSGMPTQSVGNAPRAMPRAATAMDTIAVLVNANRIVPNRIAILRAGISRSLSKNPESMSNAVAKPAPTPENAAPCSNMNGRNQLFTSDVGKPGRSVTGPYSPE